MELYGLKTCDSCRKAIKALPQVTYVDVRSSGVPENVLNAAFSEFGMALINKSSATWRTLDDSQRARDPIDLISENPTLMKRPLIVGAEKMTLGWKVDAQEVWL